MTAKPLETAPVRRTELARTTRRTGSPNRQQLSQENAMVGPLPPAQIYPLGHVRAGADPRFTVGLITAVAEVLSAHGYPDLIRSMSGRDFANLRQAVFRFLYGLDEEAGLHSATCSVWLTPHCNCGGDHR